MDFKGIPVVPPGPGSQPEEADGAGLSYLDMPRGMDTYRLPDIPAAEAIAHLGAARDTVAWLSNALREAGTQQRAIADLGALDPASRELVNQVLGEGEVSITTTGALRGRTQESVLAGVWRTVYFDDQERAVADLLEVAAVPHVVDEAGHGLETANCSSDDVPAEVMNGLPILAELESACADYRREARIHSINLTLLPLSDADVEFLDQRLGRGSVDILSRSYGKCQVTSTAIANVWWVRYYNAMNTLILNTLEVTDIPSVVAAAPEDLRDSAVRLEDIIETYLEDVG